MKPITIEHKCNGTSSVTSFIVETGQVKKGDIHVEPQQLKNFISRHRAIFSEKMIKSEFPTLDKKEVEFLLWLSRDHGGPARLPLTEMERRLI